MIARACQRQTVLTASTKVEGTTFGAEIDGGVKEISAERDVEMGDQTVNVQPSWLVQAKTARVKLMSKISGGDKLSAQIDYNPDSKATAYEVTYDHNLEDGRDISATVDGDSGTVDVDYVDSKFEKDATWTATASVPYDSGKDLLDSAKLSLKRSWKW